MNDFYRGYILSYFKDHKQHYSFLFLAQNLGLAVSSIHNSVSRAQEDVHHVPNIKQQELHSIKNTFLAKRNRAEGSNPFRPLLTAPCPRRAAFSPAARPFRRCGGG